MQKINFIMKWTAPLVLMAASHGAFAYGDVPDGDVYINQVIYGGTGCPQGSVSELMSNDKQSFTLLMDEYIAEIGPYIPRRDNRKNCQLTIDLVVPAGWSYAIATFDYRGYANIDSGVEGTQKASYYFQGQGRTGSFTSKIKGKYDNNYHFRDQIGLESYAWSPCGDRRALSVNSEVRLATRLRDAQGIMTIDSVDGSVVQKYGLVWRRCHN